jgi:hypothetical protein
MPLVFIHKAVLRHTGLYFLFQRNNSRRMRWVWHVARLGEKRYARRVSVRKPERKRPLEISRYRLEGKNRMNLGEIGWGGIDGINLAQNRGQCRAFVNTVMNIWASLYVRKFLSS